MASSMSRWPFMARNNRLAVMERRLPTSGAWVLFCGSTKLANDRPILQADQVAGQLHGGEGKAHGEAHGKPDRASCCMQHERALATTAERHIAGGQVRGDERRVTAMASADLDRHWNLVLVVDRARWVNRARMRTNGQKPCASQDCSCSEVMLITMWSACAAGGGNGPAARSVCAGRLNARSPIRSCWECW